MSRAEQVAEQARVNEAIARVLRAWLVANHPLGDPLVPTRWLRAELYALREGYPGDRRVARARGYAEAIADVSRLLDLAETKQQP